MQKATANGAAVRREPMQQLEQRVVGQEREDWRQGPAMRKEVSRRKTLVYALMRRVNACSGTLSASAKLECAVQSLHDLCSSVGEALTAKQPTRVGKDGSAPPCSILQLVTHLGKEETPCGEYEEMAFGWEAMKPMPGGRGQRKQEQ